MTAVEVDDAEPTAAADVMQAAYFRATLVSEREHLAAQVVKHREVLVRRAEAGSTRGIAHLTSQVKALEAELRYLDGLLVELERRFAPRWTQQGV